MTDLRSLTKEQVEKLCLDLGWQRFRARQLYDWLWHKGAQSLDAMTNLSKEQRRLLSEKYSLGGWDMTVLRPAQFLLSDSSDRVPTPIVASRAPGDGPLVTISSTLAAEDGTVKFTFRLADGAVIESVYLPEGDRRTVCVSSQVGCGLACDFCATGRLGFRRDLAWCEIAAQVLAVREYVAAHLRSPAVSHEPALTNVVFMGMGEPFLNYDAVIEAVRVINDNEALGIGARHITISTSGIPKGIRAYAQFTLQTRLALSLNASDDETRSRLMPVNRQFPLKEVMAAVRAYAEAKGKRVTLEYVMVAGVNDRNEDVQQLARLLHGLPCKVNLIPLNPFPGCDLRPPSPAHVEAFAKKLWPLLPAITVRRSKGAEVMAGCGQLAGGT